MRLRVALAAIGAWLLAAAPSAFAGQTQVAVAANFTAPAKEIAAAFKAKTGDEAQTEFRRFGPVLRPDPAGRAVPGVPVGRRRPAESGDRGRPRRRRQPLHLRDRQARPGSKSLDVAKGDEALKAGAFAKLAIANPKSAPYGAAAVEAMTKLGLYDAIQPKIVQGASIGQAFEFVDTGNAELGFVALSQFATVTAGSRWLVPQELYAPIRQDAALLKTGADDETSKAFLAFLKGPEARAIIEKYGYGLE